MQLLGTVIGKESVYDLLVPFLLPAGLYEFAMAGTGAAVLDLNVGATC